MTSRKKKRLKDAFARNLILSIIGLAVGYFFLTEVSRWERLPLGQVPYIVLGCVLIAVSGIALLYLLKQKYTPQKKRTRSRHVFLKDQNEKNNEK